MHEYEEIKNELEKTSVALVRDALGAAQAMVHLDRARVLFSQLKVNNVSPTKGPKPMPVNFEDRPPIVLRFLIACHIAVDPDTEIGMTQWESNAGREVREWLLDNDLVDFNYRTTPRGKAWLRLASNTPLPVEVYQGYSI